MCLFLSMNTVFEKLHSKRRAEEQGSESREERIEWKEEFDKKRGSWRLEGVFELRACIWCPRLESSVILLREVPSKGLWSTLCVYSFCWFFSFLVLSFTSRVDRSTFLLHYLLVYWFCRLSHVHSLSYSLSETQEEEWMAREPGFPAQVFSKAVISSEAGNKGHRRKVVPVSSTTTRIK